MVNYDPHKWTSHLFDIRGSVIGAIFTRMIVFIVWSAAVTAAHLHWHPFGNGLGTSVHSLVGLALGLLLVFRTNASYDRFWEGRKLWGGIVNETRNLARQARALLAADPALRRELILWTAAFAHASMNSLRGTRGLGALAHELPKEKVDEIMAAQHVPLAVAVHLTELIVESRRRALIDPNQQVALDQNVQLLIDYLGGCERIHKTPVPFAYVVHLRRALIFYLASLPFALIDALGWVTVPAVTLVCYVFFGIEEIGVEIEDPFGTDANDLPLDRICQTIEKNLVALAS